jgi:E3 ubiquitin-protein ligase FANCL
MKTIPECFPHLVPKNGQLTKYHGYVINDSYECEIEFKDDHVMIQCNPELIQLLNNDENGNRTLQRLSNCKTPQIFMNEFKYVLDRHLELQQYQIQQIQQQKQQQYNTQFYKQVMNQIDTIGWNRIVDLDTNLTTIDMWIKDVKNREHIVHVVVGVSNDSNIQLQTFSNLPLQIVQTLQKKHDSTLQSILEHYTSAINDQLQLFFSIMDCVDSSTWVLEPEHPNYSHTVRRIAIGSHSSIQIEVDPLHPTYLPQFRFLGADSIINPVKESLHKKQHIWNNDVSSENYIQQLQDIFSITFPVKQQVVDNSELSEECGICYAYRQDDMSIPDKVCENIKCCMPFHTQCLSQWLRALPDAVQRFDTLSGKCPYCSESISVKI